MTRYTIAIDNGSSGSIAVLENPDTLHHFGGVISFKQVANGKTGKTLSRLDRTWLRNFLQAYDPAAVRIYLERHFTGSGMMINTVIPAARFEEATVTVIEDLGLPYEIVSCREWQKAAFGPALKTTALLKAASLQKATQLWPAFTPLFQGHGDGDAALIARHYARS